MFRESIRFLRMYFIFNGLVGGYLNLASLFQVQRSVIDLFFGLIGLGLSIAWVYVGISFRKLLIESPKIITTCLLVQMVFLVSSILVVLVRSVSSNLVAYSVLGLVIDCYLLYNVKCLAAEERSKKENQ